MQDECDKSQSESSKSLLARRDFLILSGVTAAGVLGAFFYRKKDKSVTDYAKAFAILKDVQLNKAISAPEEVAQGDFYSIKPVKGIPESWVNQKGLDVLRYANYIQNLGLKNVTPYHVLYPHFKTRGRFRNSLPPKHMWRNIVPTLSVVDKIANRLNAKLKPIISVYRSPTYHRAVRGRKESPHLTNRAVDIQFYGVEAHVVARVARQLRKEGFFKGGVEKYRTFVHIDTCGHNVDW